MSSKVSIIIPCYNQGRYLDDAVSSVLASNYDNFEIIIVNDGSIDQYTRNLLRTYGRPKTNVLNIPNRGVSIARNFGISFSTGEYILLLDADDMISKEYISRAVKVLDSNIRVKIVKCEVEMFGARRGRYLLPEHSMETLLGQNTMVISSFFRRSDFNDTIGFNSNMKMGFEDWDFWLTMLESGGDVYHLNSVEFFYRIKRGSRNNSILNEQYSLLRKQIYENHKMCYSSFFFDPTKSFEYCLVKNSKDYQLGRFLLRPIRKILKFFI